MPIHEYKCAACGHEFEELVRTVDEKVRCAKCGSARLERKLSTFAAVVGAGGSDPSCDYADECPRGGCCGGSCNLGDD